MPLHHFAEHTAANPQAAAVIDADGIITSRATLLTGAHTLAGQLRERGVHPGSTVLLRTPRPGVLFHAADLAVLLAGAVPASIAEHPTGDELAAALRVLRPACIIDTEPETGTLLAVAAEHRTTYHPLTALTAAADLDAALHHARRADPGAVACVVATSGSTGRTQFVAITGPALVDGLNAWRELWPPTARTATRVVTHLPVSHIAQRIMGHYLLCLHGSTIYPSQPDTLATTVATARPQVLLAVPHTLARLARDADQDDAPGLRAALADLDLVVNGGSALPAATAGALHRLAVPITGAYGMTETSVPVLHHRDEDGSGLLGDPVSGVTTRIDGGGELLIRTTFAAQYVTRWPDTATVTDPDGWIHTGDHAEATPQGLRLTGRLAATFKTARGQLIIPEPIEAYLCAQPGVAGACILGAGRPHAVAVVSMPDTAAADPARRDTLGTDLLAGLRAERAAGRLPWSDVAAVIIAGHDWSTDPDLTTRTGKPRRAAIAECYAAQLAGLFAGSAAIADA